MVHAPFATITRKRIGITRRCVKVKGVNFKVAVQRNKRGDGKKTASSAESVESQVTALFQGRP